MNHPASTPSYASPVPRSEFRRGRWIVAVIAGHGLLLAAGHMNLETSKPKVEPPTIIGMLITPPAVAVAAPVPQKQTPPKPRPKPRPAAKPRPLPPPLPEAPPSERALTAPREVPPAVETASPSVLLAELDDTSLDIAEASLGPSTSGPSDSEARASATSAAEAPVEPPRAEASHLDNPPPAYPTLSRRFNEEGRVLLDVYILPDGRVGAIKLNQSSGFRRLDAAALEAVRRWRYVPARRGDEAIPFWYVQPISFSLGR